MDGINYFMIIVTVPIGYRDMVIKVAKESGAVDVTVLHARGADSSEDVGFFRMKIEPEEEIVLITAGKGVMDVICRKINDEFERKGRVDRSIYILPTQCVESVS